MSRLAVQGRTRGGMDPASAPRHYISYKYIFYVLDSTTSIFINASAIDCTVPRPLSPYSRAAGRLSVTGPGRHPPRGSGAPGRE